MGRSDGTADRIESTDARGLARRQPQTKKNGGLRMTQTPA